MAERQSGNPATEVAALMAGERKRRAGESAGFAAVAAATAQSKIPLSYHVRT